MAGKRGGLKVVRKVRDGLEVYPFQLKAVLGKLTAPIPPTTRMEPLLIMVMMGNLLTALEPMTVLITLDYKMVLLITILHSLTMKYLTTPKLTHFSPRHFWVILQALHLNLFFLPKSAQGCFE
jgi:hypothetical protein